MTNEEFSESQTPSAIESRIDIAKNLRLCGLCGEPWPMDMLDECLCGFRGYVRRKGLTSSGICPKCMYSHCCTSGEQYEGKPGRRTT